MLGYIYFDQLNSTCACDFLCMQCVTVTDTYTQLKVGEYEQIVVDVVLQSLQ